MSERAKRSVRLLLLHARALLGSLNAQRFLGMAYATGDFGAWQQAKDERKALRWYARAAEQGDAEARYNLGFMLLLGEGTKADPDAAVALLEQAAQADRYDAAKLLADLYDGWGVERGVPRNAARAAYWRARVES